MISCILFHFILSSQFPHLIPLHQCFSNPITQSSAARIISFSQPIDASSPFPQSIPQTTIALHSNRHRSRTPIRNKQLNSHHREPKLTSPVSRQQPRAQYYHHRALPQAAAAQQVNREREGQKCKLEAARGKNEGRGTKDDG